jgi:hypothetical protein
MRPSILRFPRLTGQHQTARKNGEQISRAATTHLARILHYMARDSGAATRFLARRPNRSGHHSSRRRTPAERADYLHS